MATVLTKLDRSAPSNGSKGQSVLQGKKVLIVDDSPMQRGYLRELYESFGLHCVGEACNGLDCLSLAEKLQPDLISLDLIMPVMHGMEALKYLKEAGSDAVIIIATAVGKLDALTELKPSGHQPDAIFSKKDSRETFLSILQDIFLAEEEASTSPGSAELPSLDKPA